MRTMYETVVVQGRRLKPADIVRIRELIAGNPNWSRWRLSKVLCAEWGWRNRRGLLKEGASWRIRRSDSVSPLCGIALI
jgi:hypothetical protein